MPQQWKYQTACAALFTKKESSWGQSIVVISPNSEFSSATLMKQLSPMPVAGYRQRLDRLIAEVRRESCGPAVLFRLVKRVTELNPELPLQEIRLYRASWPTNHPEMTHPAGRWELPDVSQIPKERLKTLAHWKKVDGKWRAVKSSSNNKAATPTAPVVKGAAKAPNPLGNRRIIRVMPTMRQSEESKD